MEQVQTGDVLLFDKRIFASFTVRGMGWGSVSYFIARLEFDSRLVLGGDI